MTDVDDDDSELRAQPRSSKFIFYFICTWMVNLCGELIRPVIKLFASNLSSTLEPLCVSALESFMIGVYRR